MISPYQPYELTGSPGYKIESPDSTAGDMASVAISVKSSSRIDERVLSKEFQ
jgi:hypothetical protein